MQRRNPERSEKDLGTRKNPSLRSKMTTHSYDCPTVPMRMS